MTTPTTCQCCNTAALNQVLLSHEESGAHITVCPRCLRSAARLKADAVGIRSRLVLRDYADEHGCQVWGAPGAIYVLPSVQPFAAKSDLVTA